MVVNGSVYEGWASAKRTCVLKPRTIPPLTNNQALRLWVLSVPMEEALPEEEDRDGTASYWSNVSLLICVPKREAGVRDCVRAIPPCMT